MKLQHLPPVVLRQWHDRLDALIYQVGHPHYLLSEVVNGLRQIRDEMIALSAAQPSSNARAVMEKCIEAGDECATAGGTWHEIKKAIRVTLPQSEEKPWQT